LVAISPGLAFAADTPEGSVADDARAMVQREIAENGSGVVALVAKDDRVIFRSARGRADVELGVPLDSQSVFRIASITKTVTATTVLKLIGAGKLSLNDRLSKFAPDFPKGENISVAQLLGHTSGVSDGWKPIRETSGIRPGWSRRSKASLPSFRRAPRGDTATQVICCWGL
jgi:D-alanyl-D-alanine carboxypeptidase